MEQILVLVNRKPTRESIAAIQKIIYQMSLSQLNEFEAKISLTEDDLRRTQMEFQDNLRLFTVCKITERKSDLIVEEIETGKWDTEEYSEKLKSILLQFFSKVLTMRLAGAQFSRKADEINKKRGVSDKIKAQISYVAAKSLEMSRHPKP